MASGSWSSPTLATVGHPASWPATAHFIVKPSPDPTILRPDTITHNAAISACEKAGAWEQARTVASFCTFLKQLNVCLYDACQALQVFVALRRWHMKCIMLVAHATYAHVVVRNEALRCSNHNNLQCCHQRLLSWLPLGYCCLLSDLPRFAQGQRAECE